MSALPPVATTWLPELHEAHDGPREVIKLVNQLRRRIIGYSPSGGGPVLLSYSLPATENALGGTFAVETWLTQRPVPYVSFSSVISISATFWARVASGSATWSLRLGGTDSVADGAVIGTPQTLTSAAYPAWSPVTISGTAPRGLVTVVDFLKLTVVSTGNSQIREGGVTLS